MPEAGRAGRASSGRKLLATAVVAIASLVALGVAVPGRAADDVVQLALGKALFTRDATPPCAICHTLKDAGATGAVGPVLDELQPDEARVMAAVRGGIGAMPSFRDSLKDAQIEALARYVAKASRAPG